MSLRSSVNSWNAASIALVCVSAVSGGWTGHETPRERRIPPLQSTLTAVDDEKVLVLVGIDIANASEEEAGHRVLGVSWMPRRQRSIRTSSPMTASNDLPLGLDVLVLILSSPRVVAESG